MGLPLFLAMTPAEIKQTQPLPDQLGWMACHFSPYSQGLTDLPQQLPPGSLLILNDRFPCKGHSASVVAQQLRDAAVGLQCSGVLLDFQQQPEDESLTMIRTILSRLPCSAAVTPDYTAAGDCAVFLSPPLHVPAEAYLQSWKSREIWLEAALCQQRSTVTKQAVTFAQLFPTQKLTGGFYDPRLRCRYFTEVSEDAVTFTLFDTPETLKIKLELAHSLGVACAVGLYQELGTFLTGKSSA